MTDLPQSEHEDLTVAHIDGVAILTLNCPARLNALSLPMREQLIRIIPLLTVSPAVRCILITGAGRGFCAGGDFKGERTNGPAEVRVRLDLAYRWIRMLMLGEKPVVTAVNGPAAGAGFALALMGDVIVASDQAFFKAGFPAMGTVPDYGLAWTLPRTIGVLQAKEVLLCNRRIPAAEAQRLGFVSRVVPHDDLFNEAMRVARQLASGPYATGPAKRMITLAPSLSLEAFLEQEAMAQTIAFASQDYAEGALAFREHREPRFVGA